MAPQPFSCRPSRCGCSRRPAVGQPRQAVGSIALCDRGPDRRADRIAPSRAGRGDRAEALSGRRGAARGDGALGRRSPTEAGLGHAAMVPDALALPQPPKANGRSIWARRARWSAPATAADSRFPRRCWAGMGAAGSRPAALAYGAAAACRDDAGRAALAPGALADAAARARARPAPGPLCAPPPGNSNFWRGSAGSSRSAPPRMSLIAFADTLMLRSIADRREAETRTALHALAAPGANLGGDLPRRSRPAARRAGAGRPTPSCRC
jgi:hypothetical protein